MVNSRRKWCCPYCTQTSSRHGNLKIHIKRKHQGIGEPVREDEWHYTRTTTASTPAHFIPDIMSWQNNNNYHLNQRYPQTFSSVSPYFKKEEDTSKKRDALDEILELWQPKAQKMKELLEIIKTFNEFSSFFSSSQQPNIITSLGLTPIIQPTIPSPVTTTPSQQIPQSAQSSQEQEQKNQNINPFTAFANLFYTSTFMAQELQRRVRAIGEGKDSIIVPQGPSLHTHLMTTTSHDSNKDSKKRGRTNQTTENMKQQELEEDRHDIEEEPSSKSNLSIDNEDDYVINNDIDYYDDSSDISIVIKRDKYRDIYERYKV
jgi:hypothetical protein